MSVQRLLKIITFCALLASCPAWAQSYFCKHVGIRDGFSANEILASRISNTSNDQAVYFGGTGGLVEILSRAVSRENHSLELDLYEVSSSGKRLSCKTGGGVTIPWFRSWWFYTIILVLVTLLVAYAAYRYNERIQQNLAQTLSRWMETSVQGSDAPRKSALGQEGKDLLGRLNRYVEEHMSDNNLNVAEIAREVAMSRASLYSKVKALTGMGVAQYVEDLRIRRACHLLKETRKSVSEISEEVGFSSPNYFSMRFKQAVGISPLTFRKNARDSV